MINVQSFMDHYNKLNKSYSKALSQSESSPSSQRIKGLDFRNEIVRRFKDEFHQMKNLGFSVKIQSTGGVPSDKPISKGVGSDFRYN